LYKSYLIWWYAQMWASPLDEEGGVEWKPGVQWQPTVASMGVRPCAMAEWSLACSPRGLRDFR